MDEEPKFGLMLSLVLMNLTAVALFFLAATSPKKQADIGSPQHSQVTQVELVMAGDTEKNVFEDNALTNDEELGPASLRLKMADTLSPRLSIRLPENIHGSVEVGVLRPPRDTSNRSYEFPASARNAEPPLAAALKRFVINSKSGVIRLFAGLKNGYMEKRAEKRLSAEKASIPRCESRELLDSWIWGSWDEGSKVNQETVVSTEIVMDVLSKTQKRTNELIDVFSKKVVPAIERMNDRVAEAIRLEKNLDSYTSTLIRAIDSVVCPPVENLNSDPKTLQSGTNVNRKSRQGKRSDLSLVQYTPKPDSLGSFNKGERSESLKRPVFKTLTARCVHSRKAIRSNKTKEYRRCEQQQGNVDQLLQLERAPLDVEAELSKLEKIGLVTTGNDQGHNVGPLKENGLQEGTCEEKQERTICIEDVLALTSSMEQSYDQDIRLRSDVGFTFDQSALSSDFSMSSGIGIRSPCIIENLKQDSAYARTEENSTLMLPVNQSPEITAPQQVGSLTSDCTVVCDSRIQGYESYLARRESSTTAHFPGREHQTDLNSGHQDREHSITSGNNTNDLVNVFKRLDLRGKEIAMENVCLLVLRIFEAWSESQQPVSPLTMSKMSLNSWISKDEISLGENRPRTAICRSSIMDSVPEQQPMANSSHQAYHTLPDEQAMPQTTSKHEVLEISRSLVQCAVEAAEVQIVEQSLKGLKTNIHRASPKDRFLASPDAANPSGFGDTMKDSAATENGSASLACKSHDSITEASKESSSATFYTGQPESSEDAFYECISTISAGTFGSLELEDSSKLFLERIQEEETKVREKCNEGTSVERPQTAHSSFSIESWLNDSGEELQMTKDEITSLEFSDNSSVDVGCGTDDEFPSTSLDEFGSDMSQKEKQKKKTKWGAKLLKKFLKKKSKPSTLQIPALSNGAPRSRSDSAVLKLGDPDIAKSVDEQAQ